MNPQILIVDDDKSFREGLSELMGRWGYRAETAGDAFSARCKLRARQPGLLMTDIVLPDGNGLDLIRDFRPLSALVFTGFPSVDNAVMSLRSDVDEFLIKPIDTAELKRTLQRLLPGSASGARPSPSTSQIDGGPDGAERSIVGSSPAMQRVFKLIRSAADNDYPCFVCGESGTGKELVVNAIHRLGKRSGKPFRAVNCAAFSESLIASELFGHEKGSFTGASSRRKGLFESGDGGTLFLDEITEMPLDLQASLLRVLENGVISRVGGDEEIETDVRVIAASNRDPVSAVTEGRLREDLYYRLNLVCIEVPPLRQRGDDIIELASSFLAELNEKNGTNKRFDDAALGWITGGHDWPGNVRELKYCVTRGYLLADRIIDLRQCMSRQEEIPDGTGAGRRFDDLVGLPMSEVEDGLIVATLKHCDGNKKEAASLLGICLKTLYNRLKRIE